MQMVAVANLGYISAITGTGTGSLRITTGTGNPIPGFSTNGATPTTVQGSAALGAAPTDKPLATGCNASTGTPTAQADATAQYVRCDRNGNIFTWPFTNPENYTIGLITTPMTGTTSTAITGMGAPGSGLRNYVTEISCPNAHASVDTLVNIQDGSGGAVIAQLTSPHNFGAHEKPFPAPLRQPTTNTALYAVDTVTGASVTCSATGFKAP
jgi:hypothetical protein